MQGLDGRAEPVSDLENEVHRGGVELVHDGRNRGQLKPQRLLGRNCASRLGYIEGGVRGCRGNHDPAGLDDQQGAQIGRVAAR